MILFTGGGLPGPGGCMVWGVGWSGGVVPGPGGSAWSRSVLVKTPTETATAAVGTHPTGMHSCI